jgi:hypothetical protein
MEVRVVAQLSVPHPSSLELFRMSITNNINNISNINNINICQSIPLSRRRRPSSALPPV